MSETVRDKKIRILDAGKVAVDELIKVLRDPIIGNSMISEDGKSNEVSADKMKNAAAAKRLAFEDALSMLTRIDEEEASMNEKQEEIKESAKATSGFAERYVKGSK